MIVGSQKPIDEIWNMVKDFKKVLVFGCNTCVAICHAGGEKEAETIASLIKMKASQEGKSMVVNHMGVMRHCEPEYFEPVIDEVKKYDLVLSTACGVGVNFLSDRTGTVPVYPGHQHLVLRRCRSARRCSRSSAPAAETASCI